MSGNRDKHTLCSESKFDVCRSEEYVSHFLLSDILWWRVVYVMDRQACAMLPLLLCECMCGTHYSQRINNGVKKNGARYCYGNVGNDDDESSCLSIWAVFFCSWHTFFVPIMFALFAPPCAGDARYSNNGFITM